ncbi:MAG: ATP-binding protein [Pseudomonadota bacterium]
MRAPFARLGNRVLALVLAFNALLSVLATGVQLYASYYRQDAALKAFVDETRRGYEAGLSAAVWAFDFEQVELLLTGIAAHQEIAALRLISGERAWLRGQSPEDLDFSAHEISLMAPVEGRSLDVVGVLQISLSRKEIWRSLYEQVGVVLLSNLAKTIAASIFILFVIDRVATRHLHRLAAFVRRKNWLTEETPLVLQGDGRAAEEIVALTDAVNTARMRVRQSVEAVEASFHLFRTLIDASPNGIIGFGADGAVAELNPAARSLLGFDDPETTISRLPETTFLHVETLQPLRPERDPVQRCVSGEEFQREKVVVARRGTGERIYLNVTGHRLDKPTPALAAILMLEDISEVERNRQQVERASRLDALGSLTAGIAHDFNNLLTSVIYAIKLASDAKDDEKRATYLDLADTAASRGVDLTGRLLAFARREPGMSASRPVAETLGGMQKLLRPMVEATIDLRFSVEPSDLTVFCDHSQLENAVLNLVVNARDAILRSGADGEIVVEARSAPALDDAAEGDFVEIVVKDDGPGMDEEVRRRATDPFFTTKDGAELSGVSGTGLGLSMVFGFVARSGGALQIDAAPDGGASVRMRLPANEAVSAAQFPAG